MLSNTQTSLTDQQLAALAADERSVSLAAGAGCGKTFVLTERFLSYVDPVCLKPSADIEELVAITFTEAAAREMRDRIRRRCHDRFHNTSSLEERMAWQKIIRNLDAARITTIHSFCSTILRTYPVESELDPRFELLDGPATELLKLQTVDDRLRQLLIEKDERLIQLATRFDLRNLREHLVNLLSQNTNLFLSEWRLANPQELIEKWLEFRERQIVPIEIRKLLNDESLLHLKAISNSDGAISERLKCRLHEIAELFQLIHNGVDEVENLKKLETLAKTKGVCTKKDWENEEQYNQYLNNSKAVRELIKKSIIFLPTAEFSLHDSATTGLELLELVEDISSCYTHAKNDRNVLEFDDLLLKTYQLLTNKQNHSVHAKLYKGIRLLMVDEFQDTDPLQVDIVKALCGSQYDKQGLFVVGDFKQSIYRFRGAEPKVSSQLRASLPEKNRLSLSTNFRSQPAILDFVNALFHEAFEEDHESLQAHRQQIISAPAVEFLWASQHSSEEELESSHSYTASELSRIGEARYIARRLAGLLESGNHVVVDEESKESRPLRLGDIAILLRSLSDVNLYESALREHGLDYYLSGGHAFYSQQEIYDVLNLLRAICSSADELSLAGALRSPFFFVRGRVALLRSAKKRIPECRSLG